MKYIIITMEGTPNIRDHKNEVRHLESKLARTVNSSFINVISLCVANKHVDVLNHQLAKCRIQAITDEHNEIWV